MRVSSLTIWSALVAALGGFLFGFDTAVISGTTSHLERVFQLSGAGLGVTVASALVGTILGSIGAGPSADRWGRKRVMIALAVLYLVSALGSAWAWNWGALLFFRWLGGLAVGASSVVAPMYIAEISPPESRGRLVAITQLNIVIGILAAFFSNYWIARQQFGESEWRWMFGVEAIPAGLFFLFLWSVPRSPRWLVARGWTEEAAKVLRRLGIGEDRVGTLIEEIRQSLQEEREALRVPLFQKAYLRPILLAIAIAAFNQLSGINAVLYYAPKIFEMAGAGKDAALLQAVAVGGINLVVTILAMILIDRVGRRILMLFGSIGYIVSLTTIAWAFFHYGSQFDATGNTIVLVSTLVFIAAHAFGQGAVIWVFISEIFPNEVRARGQALGSFTHWTLCTLITFSFPVIAERSGGYAFAFYAIMMVLQLLWVLFVMPETKGVPLEKIKERLRIG